MDKGITMSAEFENEYSSHAGVVAHSDDPDCRRGSTRGDVSPESDGGNQERETCSAAAVRLGRVITEVRCAQDGCCPICHTDLKGRSVAHLPCGHALHGSCHVQLYNSACQTREKCPVCRESFLKGMRKEIRDRLIAARPLLAMELLLAEGEDEDNRYAEDAEAERAEEERAEAERAAADASQSGSSDLSDMDWMWTTGGGGTMVVGFPARSLAEPFRAGAAAASQRARMRRHGIEPAEPLRVHIDRLYADRDRVRTARRERAEHAVAYAQDTRPWGLPELFSDVADVAESIAARTGRPPSARSLFNELGRGAR